MRERSFIKPRSTVIHCGSLGCEVHAEFVSPSTAAEPGVFVESTDETVTGWWSAAFARSLEGIAEPMENDPVKRISRDEAPTITWNVPGVTIQPRAVASQFARSSQSRLKVTCCVCSGESVIFWNPLSSFGGSPAAAGKPRYSCGTSAPV